MSRTKRTVPYWNRGILPCEKYWIALSDMGICYYHYDEDIRNEHIHGYDGCGSSFYYSGYRRRGWRHNYSSGAVRKYVKRRYAKQRRVAFKKEVANVSID